MKIKFDFVTNSSSTSFIIGDKSGKLDKILINVHKNINVNLFEILRPIEIKNAKDVGDEVSYYPEAQEKLIRKCSEIILNGGKIYVFYASDQGDSLLEAGFCIWGIWENDIVENKELIEIIKGEGGY